MEETLKIFDLSVRDAQMIVVGTVFFFLFWRLMHSLVILPFIKLYEQREALTTGVTSSTKEILEEAIKINREVDQALNQTRAEALSKKVAAINEAKKKAGALVADAEKDGAIALQAARDQRKASAEEVRKKLFEGAEGLASELAENILTNRGKGSSAIH